jgi:hypothetical protein
MAEAKTPCCGELVVVDGSPCIAWSVWESQVKCLRCGTTYAPDDASELPAPQHMARASAEPKRPPAKRIKELEEGDTTWIDCRGVLSHEESGKMWIDPRFATTHEPIMNAGFEGLCSVLVQRVGETLVAIEGIKAHTTLILTERGAGVSRPLEWRAE